MRKRVRREPRGRGVGQGGALRRAVAALLIGVLSVGALAACGGSAGAEAPAAVSSADLGKDGEFWRGLTPDLKDELVELAKDRLADDRPSGGTHIKAFPTGGLVDEVEKQYANESKRDRAIFTVYTQANDRVAAARVSEIDREIELLCSTEEIPPPECDEQ